MKERAGYQSSKQKPTDPAWPLKAFTVPVGLGSIRSFVCLVVLLPFYSADFLTSLRFL